LASLQSTNEDRYIMPFHDSGFLSSDAPWVQQNRQRHAPWFDLVAKLNRFAVSVLLREVRRVPEELYVATLYARAVTMFEGAVLLAEIGMAAESRTLVRGCAETAIAIGCTRLDKTFLRRLDEDHDKHRVAMANDLLRLPEDDPNISPEQRADLSRLIAEVTAQYGHQRPKGINWADASNTAAMTDLYLTVYRRTSGDAAHVSLQSLDRHIASNDSGAIAGFQFRPFLEDTVDTLSSAIAALCHATEAKVRGLGDAAVDATLIEITRAWRTLVETSA
jgi:hypothetical protein